MTVIAWDGRMLAADKAATNVGHSSTVRKIYRIPDGLVGLSGAEDAIGELLHWFKSGRVVTEWPAMQRTDEERAYAIFIDKEARVWAYGRTPFPVQHEVSYTACGSGRDYALAALYLGHDAVRAVEVACALDVNCGQGVDFLLFDEL